MTQTNLIKGTLLVAGTAIGGGMLALPVLTAEAGFLPAIVVYIFCWLFMTCTGLLFLELCLWQHSKDTNIVSMASATMGQKGKILSWIVYIFLFYSLTLAYVVGCGNLFASISGGLVSDWIGSLIFVALFAPLVYVGTWLVGKINFYLMIALIISFFAFVLLGLPHVNTELLTHRNWIMAFSAVPIAFTSFAYQGIVPSLTSYMHYNPKKIRFAIIFGTFIPFIAYIIWEWLILGIVPLEGAGGLIDAKVTGKNAVTPLKEFLNNPYIYVIGQFFAFFAMVTSFLGVTLGLKDFLADGLNIKQNRKGKLFICALIFIPPLIFARTHPHVFLTALDYAGGFGCAFLLGLLPIIMVWISRYRLKIHSSYQFPGGKLALVLLGIFVVLELLFEVVRLG